VVGHQFGGRVGLFLRVEDSQAIPSFPGASSPSTKRPPKRPNGGRIEP
jgi:hypothetical protein